MPHRSPRASSIAPPQRSRTAALCALVGACCALAGGSAAPAGARAGAAPQLRHCADLVEADGQTGRQIPTRGLSCRLARLGVATFLGSPQGCLTSAGCPQTGVGHYRHSLVACRRVAHRVTCTVLVPSARGTVSFVVHPIGDPGQPGSRS